MTSYPARYQYTKCTLSESDLYEDPFQSFEAWYKLANEQKQNQNWPISPEVCCLSTSELPSGRVSSRYVLLKGYDADQGFVIYSNSKHSRKARDLYTNRFASLALHWEPLQKQIRIEGIVEYMTKTETKEYFNTRPIDSRIGAYASKQSEEISGRSELEENYEKTKVDLERALNVCPLTEQTQIDPPDYWCGFKIKPFKIEFWQGRENRLHDRIVYSLDDENECLSTKVKSWTIKRLSP